MASVEKKGSNFLLTIWYFNYATNIGGPWDRGSDMWDDLGGKAHQYQGIHGIGEPDAKRTRTPSGIHLLMCRNSTKIWSRRCFCWWISLLRKVSCTRSKSILKTTKMTRYRWISHLYSNKRVLPFSQPFGDVGRVTDTTSLKAWIFPKSSHIRFLVS